MVREGRSLQEVGFKAVGQGHQLRKGLLQNAFSLGPRKLRGQWMPGGREREPGWEARAEGKGRGGAQARQRPGSPAHPEVRGPSPRGPRSVQLAAGAPLCVLTFKPGADS